MSAKVRATAPPSDAAQGGASWTALAPTGGERALWIVALALAALYPVMYVAVALMRMGHPFELEWMEGGVVDHVRHLLAGKPMYVEPSLEFTPFIYPPLYFQLGAWVSKLFGVGFVPLRALSFVSSLGIIACVFLAVRRRGASLVPAVLAACLFAGAFREGGAWLDLARVDSLYLFFVAAGIVLVRSGSPWLGGALGGLAFALAALTKQSALFIAAPIGLVLLVADWRRAIGFGGTFALVAGGVSLWLDQASGGWYRYYVFDLPRHHPIIGQLLRGFWTSDLLGAFAISLVIGAFRFARITRATWRRDAVDLAILIGLLATAYVTKIRVGSFDNLVLPAHLACALALGWGLDAWLEFRASFEERGVALGRFVAVLCLVQFTLLLYKPWQQIPSRAEVAAGNQIVDSIRRVPGDAWIPSHPYLAEMAGKPVYAHELAITDVLRAGESPAQKKLQEEMRSALRSRRFGLVVLDHTGWLRDEVMPYYDHTAQMFGKDEPDLFWSITGFRTRPDFVWMPKRDSLSAP